MTIRAYGDNAAVELFEHHLVITRRRPGFIVDGSPAEQFIPFSSIKFVEFVRPGFIVNGRILLKLAGGSSGKADECAVSFPKSQVRQFEDVLRTVRQAIATPSIERLAMAAAQNRERIAPSPPSAAEGRQEIVITPSNFPAYEAGSRYDPAHGDDDRAYVRKNEHSYTPINPTLGSWWQEIPLLGKIAVIGFGIFLLFGVLAANEAPSTATQPLTLENVGANSSPTPEQQLSDLAEFITGKVQAGDVAVTDGPGKVGEFCSASSGTKILTFGGSFMDGQQTGVYDYYFAYEPRQGGISTSGKFQFDRTTGRVSISGVSETKSGSKEGTPIPDMALTITQVSDGVVDVFGVIFHSCVI